MKFERYRTRNNVRLISRHLKSSCHFDVISREKRKKISYDWARRSAASNQFREKDTMKKAKVFVFGKVVDRNANVAFT